MDLCLRIIIADDKAPYRNIYREGLQPYNIITVGEAENGIRLLELLSLDLPDIVLLDLNMPEMDGNEAMHHLSLLYPKLKVVILSYFNNPILVEDFYKRGARGFVVKDEIIDDMRQLSGILRKVQRGGRHFNFSTIPPLTAKQREILQLYASGLTKRDISKQLGVTENYLLKQEKNLIEKTGTVNLIAFLSYAVKAGLEFLRKHTFYENNAAFRRRSGGPL